MNTNTLLLAIIGHLVGDYLLQNDWMALNKKKPTLQGLVACWVHSIIWATCVCLFAGWPIYRSWAFVVLLFAHVLQDGSNIIARWMDLIGQKQFRTGVCAPWSIIVVDNVWHIVTIWAVWRWLT